jgi:predicted Fe-S protein YdhL (DUF1289 family)
VNAVNTGGAVSGTDPEDPYDSPCVRVCAIDQKSGFCLGCARTLTEISRWTRYVPAERRAILDALPARFDSLDVF